MNAEGHTRRALVNQRHVGNDRGHLCWHFPAAVLEHGQCPPHRWQLPEQSTQRLASALAPRQCCPPGLTAGCSDRWAVGPCGAGPTNAINRAELLTAILCASLVADQDATPSHSTVTIATDSACSLYQARRQLSSTPKIGAYGDHPEDGKRCASNSRETCQSSYTSIQSSEQGDACTPLSKPDLRLNTQKRLDGVMVA